MNDQYNVQAIIDELTKTHKQFCPAEDGPQIWVGEVHPTDPHRGQARLEVEAECQNCMQGHWTVIPDLPEYHIQPKKEVKRKHARVS